MVRPKTGTLGGPNNRTVAKRILNFPESLGGRSGVGRNMVDGYSNGINPGKRSTGDG